MTVGVVISGLEKYLRKLKKMGPAGEQAMSNVMNRVADRTLERIEKGMNESPATGRTYFRQNPQRVHKASAASGRAYPRIDQKKLLKSIRKQKATRKKPVMRVGTTLSYGSHLEFGTTKMAARPWLRRSFISASRTVARELRREFEILRK